MRTSRYIFLVCMAALMAGCGRNFKVSGAVDSATGETIYLEEMGLMKTMVLDSVVLKANGKFSFKVPSPEYPELYRLRVSGKTLVLAVDSTEQIVVEGTLAEWQDAQIIGSDESQKIQNLRTSLRDLPMEEHKAAAKDAILDNPKGLAAYYALFQSKKGEPVFDIYDKQDRAFYQAVATSLNTWYGESQRSKVLYQQVLDVMNQERRAKNAAMMQAFIDEQENTFLEISLKDEDGVEQSLSACKGHPTVLCFASCQMEKYTGFVFEMKEIWNAYQAQGLMVYEVYPDQNRLVWEDQVRALPWTTVRTENGLQSRVYATYNVQAIPTMFVLDRQGNVVARCYDFETLRKEVAKVL